jgi:hypothetical protein
VKRERQLHSLKHSTIQMLIMSIVSGNTSVTRLLQDNLNVILHPDIMIRSHHSESRRFAPFWAFNSRLTVLISLLLCENEQAAAQGKKGEGAGASNRVSVVMPSVCRGRVQVDATLDSDDLAHKKSPRPHPHLPQGIHPLERRRIARCA